MSRIEIRDATLREGMDVPGVSFSLDERLRIAAALGEAGVGEAEVVAPARVTEDVAVAAAIRAEKIPIRLSALVYANGPSWRDDAEATAGSLDRVDMLMPLSAEREPRDAGEKATRIEETLRFGGSLPPEVGAGFPHATQVDAEFVVDIARRAGDAGAARVTIYDTNGSADPSTVEELIGRVLAKVTVPVFFHAHNDLGLATANSWAAVRAGVAGLDLTVNGLGDRAGNGSLEQAVVLLARMGIETGVELSSLPGLSELVAELSGEAVPNLAPVVGRYAFDHKSPAHLDAPGEFEAIDPGRVGGKRKLTRR